MKICSKCKIEKPKTDFHKRTNRPCGVRSQCKECYSKYPKKLKRREGYMRQYDLNKSYGLTCNDYEIMLEIQKGCCKICKRHLNEVSNKRKKALCVDHCHNTNVIRGLLCDKCNRGIGLFNDSPELLKIAKLYLENCNEFYLKK